MSRTLKSADKRQRWSPHVNVVTGEVVLGRTQSHCIYRAPLSEKAGPLQPTMTTAINDHSVPLRAMLRKTCGRASITWQSISS